MVARVPTLGDRRGLNRPRPVEVGMARAWAGWLLAVTGGLLAGLFLLAIPILMASASTTTVSLGADGPCAGFAGVPTQGAPTTVENLTLRDGEVTSFMLPAGGASYRLQAHDATYHESDEQGRWVGPPRTWTDGQFGSGCSHEPKAMSVVAKGNGTLAVSIWTTP